MKSIANLSYLAGIIDGEGSIGIEHLSPTKNRSKSYYVCRLTVINTSKKLMDRLVETFGGQYDIRKKIDGRKLCYRWHIFGKDLEKVLNEIMPYLFLKNDRAELLLKYRTTVGKTGWLVSDEVLSIRKELWLQCKHLNTVGD